MDSSIYEHWKLDGDLNWVHSLTDFLPAVMSEYLAKEEGSLRGQHIETWFEELTFELEHPRLSHLRRKNLKHYPHWFVNAYVALGGTLVLEALWSETVEKSLAERLKQRRIAVVTGIERTLKGIKRKAMKNLTYSLAGTLKEHKSVVDWILGLGDLSKVTDEDAESVGDEGPFLEDRRNMAVCLFAAYKYLGEPEVIGTSAKTLLESDDAAKRATAQIVPKVPAKARNLDFMIPHMPYLRVTEPPEVYWWMWQWLEAKTEKPLSVLFGFEPIDLEAEIAKLRNVNAQS